MRSFLHQLVLALAIWVLAVIINTALGTIYLVAIKFLDAASLVAFGTMYGAIFSFPIMIAILIIINRYARDRKKGMRLFNTVLTTSVVLTVMVFFIFWKMMGLNGIIMGSVLQCIAIASGVISLITFYNRLVKCGGDLKTVQKV
ncbi:MULTISPECIES: hypothetical protein [Niastella]|uniref:DUF4293 domain-containing protein n=1 Tax=Niastella soli TaxID=2821487 RepID=A0ABS3YMI7_9BACT|nr:hypothetical protein [Niastella soli]MBO9199109.1 hypothetical protein [Niastella soli]